MADSPHYLYRVEWSVEDHEYVGLCVEFPSLSWLDPDPSEASKGIVELVQSVVTDMRDNGEELPEPVADRTYSGKFALRVSPTLHRRLAIDAAELGVSLNKLANELLTANERALRPASLR